MKNVTNFLNQWGILITIFLLFVLTIKTCNNSSKIGNLEKRVANEFDKIQVQLDTNMISEVRMIKIIKTTANWRSLELEELSDKNQIPINQLKNEAEK